VLFACAGAAPPAKTQPAAAPTPAPEAKPPARRVDVDTVQSTPGGATFTVPAGWSVASAGASTLLEGPEPGMRMAIVDSPAKDADAAVAGAWPLFRSDFKRTLKLVQPRPAREGWDEQRAYQYETSPNEKIIVGAAAQRHGESWTVVLYEIDQAAFERRFAQIGLIGQSMRPQGYARESFAGKSANVLDAARLKRITEMVEHGRETLGLPGVAIGLAQGGKVIFEGGFGVRELGRPQKVDADTLFIIASNTKALSTLLLATQVDDKKFGWGTPVAKVIPASSSGTPRQRSRC